jgi:hypothetical protein
MSDLGGGPDLSIPESIPDDLAGEIADSELWDVIAEETPGIGRLRRLYRYVKRSLSREYINEIRNLKKREDALINTLRAQTEVITSMRQYIKQLEDRLSREPQPPTEKKGAIRKKRA